MVSLTPCGPPASPISPQVISAVRKPGCSVSTETGHVAWVLEEELPAVAEGTSLPSLVLRQLCKAQGHFLPTACLYLSLRSLEGSREDKCLWKLYKLSSPSTARSKRTPTHGQASTRERGERLFVFFLLGEHLPLPS